MSAEVLTSELIFQGRVFRVRRDQVRFEDGRETHYDLVEHNGSVTLVPLDEQDQLWFVRQYRHPVGTAPLEFPAGTLEAQEDPAVCARRECREEIGMNPGTLEELATIFLAPGYSSERSHLYLASDLQPAPVEADTDEDIEIVKFSVPEVYEAIADGQIRDAKTLSALFLALPLMDE